MKNVLLGLFVVIGFSTFAQIFKRRIKIMV